MSEILMLDDNGTIRSVAKYSCDAKKALVAYLEQYVLNNFNTWGYPDDLQGIRKGSNENWLFEDSARGYVLMAL